MTRICVAPRRHDRRALRENVSRNEAEFLTDEAGIDHLNFTYREAAKKYAEAANLVGSFDRDSQWQYLLKQAGALYDHGNEFGDHAALLEAIAICRAALAERTRERVPLDWATTQNNLGGALQTLGGRESGTARLEEAVAAFAASLTVTETGWPAEWVRQVRSHRDKTQAEIGRRQAMK
jgi:hypothetical protein